MNPDVARAFMRQRDADGGIAFGDHSRAVAQFEVHDRGIAGAGLQVKAVG